MNRKQRIVAGISATALAVGAVGAAVAVTAASAEPNRPTAKGSTTVTFTDGALSALGPLSPRAARPASLGASGNGLSVQASFPIVGNSKNGVIDHVGGLTLSSGTTVLTLRNYQIDTNTGVLTANGFVNGAKVGRIPFLDVALTAPAAGCDASANLTLDGVAADALTLLFGAPDLTGAAIGTGCVDYR